MEEYKVIRSRKIKLVPAFWNGVSQTSNETSLIHGTRIRTLWMIFQQGHLTMVYLGQDWEKVGGTLLERTISDREYIPKIYREQLKLGKLLIRHSRKALAGQIESFSFKQLFRKLLKFKSLWLDFDRANVLPWHVMADYLRDHLHERLLALNSALTDEDFLLLTTPASKSFNLEEEMASYRVALQLKRHLLARSTGTKAHDSESWPENINIQINRLADKFGWIPFGYDGPQIWDASHYHSKVRELIALGEAKIRKRLTELKKYDRDLEEKQFVIRNSLGLPDELWRLITDFHAVAEMTNQRKEFSYQSHVAINRIMKQMARLLGTDIEAVAYMTDGDIASLKAQREPLLELAARRQDKAFIFAFTDGQYEEIADDAAQSLIRRMIPEVQDEECVSGDVGSKGQSPIVVGKARVLGSSDEVAKMEPGEVLVAPMTTPEYVPALRVAAAVVTDEGGVTCHAAIVSRELGIPCIIGTGSATQVFRSGDFLEIDLTRGSVRKITESEYAARVGYDSPHLRPVELRESPEKAVDLIRPKDARSEELILWLTEIGRKDFPLVGGKAANLGEIFRLCTVPPGFCVTVKGYNELIKYNTLDLPIRAALGTLKLSAVKEVNEVSKEITQLIMRAELPEAISAAVLDEYRKLGTAVAIRSSGVTEDRPGVSFAGQHESFLGIRDEDSLLVGLKKCWASLFSARALSYRAQTEVGHQQMEMAVLIQKMIEADVSGVMFTANPLADEPEILIEAFYGLGENVVSGQVTPERYTVDKESGRLKSIHLTPAKGPVDDCSAATVVVNEPFRNPSGQVLSEEEIRVLTTTGTVLEKHFGRPQDIEWAIEGSELYILQSRPVSGLTHA